MKFNFSSGITLAFGKCEPALKLNFHYDFDICDSLCSFCTLSGSYHEI